MLSPPDSPVEQQQKQSKKNPMSHLLENISSYDGNVMLAAVISLLLVILFVLLLHIYAKWFLQQARHRRRRRRSRSRRDLSMSMSMSNMLRPAGRFHHFHNFPFDNNNSIPNSVSSKGLEASTIASIPLFVYCSNNNNGEDDGTLECVVCLSVFEESDVCRCLPKCGHSFHVECIDMWLHSHTNCPICRAPVVSEKIVAVDIVHDNDDEDSVEAAGPELVEIVVVNVEQQEGRESSNCDEISGDHDQIQDVGLLNHDRSSSSSSASSGSSSLGSSLKRMLSRNSRSDHHQSKVFPSSSDHHNNPNIVELDGS